MKKLIVVVALVLFVLVAWFFRYDVSTGAEAAYVLDRWTGKIVMCFGDECLSVNHTKPRL